MNQNQKSVILVSSAPFKVLFEKEGAQGASGNTLVSAKGTRTFDLMSTPALIEQIKGKEDVDVGLRSCFRNVLGNRVGMSTPDYTDVSWNMVFLSETSAWVKFSVGGPFFKKFLTEFQDSMKLKLKMEVACDQDNPSFSIESHEMSPSCSTGTGCYFFDDKIGVEVEQRIQMLLPSILRNGLMTMTMVICRDVVWKDLRFKLKLMGQMILEDKIQSDFQIIADDDTRFDCNKVFLACTSSAWAGMLQMDCKESNEKSIKLEMSAKGVEALLKFVYYSNVAGPMSNCVVAFELLKVGHQYDILGLEQTMRELFLGKKYDWFDVDTALMLYFWTLKVDGNEDLKWKALWVIKLKGDDFEGSTVFAKLLKEDAETVTKMIAQCFKI